MSSNPQTLEMNSLLDHTSEVYSNESLDENSTAGSQRVVSVLDPLSIPKFVNSLPNLLAPGYFIDATGGGSFDISMQQGHHNFGLGNKKFPRTKTWGYKSPDAPAWNAAGFNYLGPTIVAQENVPITINWRSKLPKRHLLPVDTSIHWAFHETDYTIRQNGVPVVPHRHGGRNLAQFDGHPDAWFTSTGLGGELAINNGNRQSYTYFNDQQAATLWYHDHALGVTRLNVYAGLAGFFILRDEYDTGTPDNPKTTAVENWLPGNYVNFDYRGNRKPDPDVFYEYPLVFQDKIFTADGELFYPASNADLIAASQEDSLPAGVPNPSIVPEFSAGNVIVVNGQAWPILDVEPRKYRFRLLNGSDSRFYRFDLPEKLEFFQIGTDNGLLNTAVRLDNLSLAPGQRADVIVDFAGYNNQTLILSNNDDGTGPVPNDPQTTGQVMAFQVGNQVTVPDVPIPERLRGEPGQPAALTSYLEPVTDNNTIARVNTGLDPYDHTFVPVAPDSWSPDLSKIPKDPLTGLPIAKRVGLFEADGDTNFDRFGRITPLLGTIQEGALKWEDPITEQVIQNQTEVWEIYNTTADQHPIHIHLTPFQLLSRQNFSAVQIDPLTGLASSTAPLTNINLIDSPTPATPNETGLLDTVIVNPGEVVRVLATFDLPGEYVWHCHILSHEDSEMMRPFTVLSNSEMASANSLVPPANWLTRGGPFA
jgi:spore coat protein A, manganese oxidase